MEVARILENKAPNKIYGIMGNIDITANNVNYSLVTEFKFSGSVMNYLNSPKAKNALKMVMLTENYLEKKVEDLSETEIKKIILANALIKNKEYIVLDYFEKGITYKERESFKRLFRKLSNEYQKSIILFTNDITFLWDIADEIIYVDNKEVINTFTKDKYFELAKLVDQPEIVKFIELMRSQNINVENYKNVLDLLKAIYRIKGE